MTTEEAKQYLSDHGYGAGTNYTTGLVAALISRISKQAAVDSLAKAERIQEIQNEIPSSEFDRYLAICARCGTLSAYLANFIDQMTPDQREIVAIQFDHNLFGTDEAMAKRFRDANNKDTINN